MQGDGSYISHIDLSLNSLITDIGYLSHYAPLFTGYHEVTILIAHAAVDKSGILFGQQRDIGKFDGATILIHHTTYHLRILFLRTFHENTVATFMG